MTWNQSPQTQGDAGSDPDEEASGGPIAVLIADDHVIAREGLRSMLEGSPLVSLVGEARDGREAIEMVGRLKPNLVLMDYTRCLLSTVSRLRVA